MIAPASEAELAEAVAGLSAPVEIVGGGTRRGLGRPVQAAAELSTAGLAGIRLYEPGTLTMVAGAGTPMAEVEAALAAENQRLAFEPIDHRRLLGTGGEPTLGGAAAIGASGPRRVQAGAMRDAMLGVRFVDGAGTVVKNGGRVMKNVTGYDLVKLMAGSHGTLGVLSEVSLKVLPAVEATVTLAVHGLDDAGAVRAMTAALTSPYDVTGAAHVPGGATLVRLEGFAASAAYRAERLKDLLGRQGEVTVHEGDGPLAWEDLRDCAPFAGRPGAVWRLAPRPSAAPAAVARIAAVREVEALYDWGGGLVWLLTPETGDAGAAEIRAAAAEAGGHATLVRADAATRAAVPPFAPQGAAAEALSAGLRAKFDPRGVLNPGRMAA